MKSLSETTTPFLLAGILLVALNLRPALASIGPLTEDIRAATALSSMQLGLLTTLPLIAFGIVSTLTPLVTRAWGIGWTLSASMGMLTVGIAMRWVAWLPALFVGTLLAGTAIALGNVLLPTLTKRNFAKHSGWVTSLYSSMMGLGAALAAGASVPLADGLGLGWRGSLAVWSLPASLAFIFWLTQAKRFHRTVAGRPLRTALRHLGSSALAWSVALFMGLQSLTFYVILAWLPAFLVARGSEESYAGWMLALSQAMGIVGSSIVPTLAGRSSSQRGYVCCLILLEVTALAGLYFHAFGWTAVWVSLIGFVLGGSFGLALLFIVVRSASTETATELSGMAQSLGYLIAALGPAIFGGLFDWTGSWVGSFAFLSVVAAFKLGMGWVAADQATID